MSISVRVCSSSRYIYGGQWVNNTNLVPVIIVINREEEEEFQENLITTPCPVTLDFFEGGRSSLSRNSDISYPSIPCAQLSSIFDFNK